MTPEEYWRQAWDTFAYATGESLPLCQREGWSGVTPVPLPPNMEAGVRYGAQVRSDTVTWWRQDPEGGVWCLHP